MQIRANSQKMLTVGISKFDDSSKVVTITQYEYNNMIEMIGWCQKTLHPNYIDMKEAHKECTLQKDLLLKENELLNEKNNIAHKEQRKQRFWKHVYMVTSGVLGLTLTIKLL